MTTHAIITPWPISQGLRAWCGYDGRHENLKGDLVGATPQAIDCVACIDSMRLAYSTLCEWVPQLTSPTLNSIRAKAGIDPLPELVDPDPVSRAAPGIQLGPDNLPPTLPVSPDGEISNPLTGQVLVEAGEVLPNVFHILDAGLPACEFSRKVPGEWPPGHRWIALQAYWEEDWDIKGVLCDACTNRADAAKRPVTPELDPQDLDVVIYRADDNVTSGPNAVKVIHRPTGIEVVSTKHRSKIKNQSEALKLLTGRVAAKDVNYLESLHTRAAPLREFPRVGWCDCGKPQHQTLGGSTCIDGHGGGPTLDEDPKG